MTRRKRAVRLRPRWQDPCPNDHPHRVLELGFGLPAGVHQAAKADDGARLAVKQRNHAVAARGVVAVGELDSVLAPRSIEQLTIRHPAHNFVIAGDRVHCSHVAGLDMPSAEPGSLEDETWHCYRTAVV